jgi:hypothetical protein
MAYIICLKNFDNIQGTLCKIAENQFDLDNLNIKQDQYKIIEVSKQDFNDIKFGRKIFDFYNGDNVTYIVDMKESIKNEENLKKIILNIKKQIKDFLDNNLSHSLYSKWDTYYNQLSKIDTKSINYPINSSIEEYLLTLNIDSLNTLQLP